jgi:hypothetical protein
MSTQAYHVPNIAPVWENPQWYGFEVILPTFTYSDLKGLRIAIAQLIQKKATQRQWRQIFQEIASFSEWLYIPVVIGLPRLGCSFRVKRISVPDD